MNNLITVDPVVTEKIEEISINSKMILVESEQLVINNQVSLVNANTALKSVKAKIKELDESRKYMTRPIDIAKKRIMELCKVPLDRFKQSETNIKRKMITFTDMLEASRIKEEARLRKLTEAKAERAEASGKIEKADELRQQAELTSVSSIVDKPQGISFSERWYSVVIDEKAVPIEYKVIDQSKLDAVARATKGSIPIPGVQFKMEKIVRSRS